MSNLVSIMIPSEPDRARFSIVALVTAVMVMIGGCASTPPLLPVAEPDKRIDFNGFSLLPPSGQEWNWVGREGQDRSGSFNATFVKRDGVRTYVAMASLLDTRGERYSNTNELLRYVKSAKIFRENPRQIGIRPVFNVDRALGQECVRYDFEAIDTRAPGHAGTTFDIDGHGIVCVHPDDPEVIGWFAYSRRSPQGQVYLAGTKEGERLLESVRFTAIHR